jgi:hypothetical protein
MKVRFIKPGAKMKLAYFVGDEADVDTKQGEELVKAGICEVIEEEKPKKPKTDK